MTALVVVEQCPDAQTALRRKTFWEKELYEVCLVSEKARVAAHSVEVEDGELKIENVQLFGPGKIIVVLAVRRGAS